MFTEFFFKYFSQKYKLYFYLKKEKLVWMLHIIDGVNVRLKYVYILIE